MLDYGKEYNINYWLVKGYGGEQDYNPWPMMDYGKAYDINYWLVKGYGG